MPHTRTYCRRPVTLSRQWTAATRLGGDGPPVATGRPRPAAELRAILDENLLTGAHPSVFGVEVDVGAGRHAVGAAAGAGGSSGGVLSEAEEEEEQRRRNALGLPWLPEYEAQLALHAQKLCEAVQAAAPGEPVSELAAGWNGVV